MKEIQIEVSPADLWRDDNITIDGKYYAVLFNDKQNELLTIKDEDDEIENPYWHELEDAEILQTAYEE